MNIEYGTIKYKIDVTQILLNTKSNNVINIPCDDFKRFKLIGIDPCINQVKSIFINGEEFDDTKEISIYDNNKIIINEPYINKLIQIHNSLIFEGNINDEIPEQLLSLQYIDPNSKVLEIGSNIGRNTCVIAKILKDSKNLTTIETIKESINILEKNRRNNNFNFKIVEGALSKTPLMQIGWRCYEKINNVLPDGYTDVKIFNYDNIKDNYDTLVIDCEGAFYYICKDFPEILRGIKLIIIENDFIDIEHKRYVDNLINKNGLVSIYQASGPFGVCTDKFYEVFKKI